MTILDVGLVTTDRTAESIIERCRVLDVKLVTLSVATMPGFKENHSPDLDAMRTLQGRLADAGINIAAMDQRVGPDQRGGSEAAMIENPSAHRREIDGHLRTLEVQGELGINQQLHYIDTPLPADPAKDELYWTNLIEIVGEISSQAEASKVQIGHHGIWRCLTDELRDQAVTDGVTEAEYRQYLRHDQHGHPGWRGPYLVRKADDVAVDVGQRVVDGVAHPGLSGEVDHALGLVRGKSCFDRLAVGQIDAQVGVVGVIGMPGQARFFDGRVVIGVVVVNANNRVAAFEQTQGEGRADEAGRAGDEVGYIHRFKLTDATGMRLRL